MNIHGQILLTTLALVAMFGWLSLGASRTKHKAVEEWLDVTLAILILSLAPQFIWWVWS